MKKIAFKMKLKNGCREEYQRRHEVIWPELLDALKQAGIHDYTIFLDEETMTLFAVQKQESGYRDDFLPELPVMRRWWNFMKDLMEVNDDNSPVVVPLEMMFHMD